MQHIFKFSFILLAMTMACEQLAEIEIPEHESQLVLSSFYKTGDTKITAYLTKSLSILSDEDPGDVWGVTVKLYENDVLIGQLEEVIGNVSRTYELELPAPLAQGKTYKITAAAPDYKTISATQRIPTAPEIISVGYFPLNHPGIDGSLKDALKVKFQDTPASDDYYEFRAYRGSVDTGWSLNWAESYTPGMEQSRGGISFLNDNLFEGTTYEVELLVWAEDTTYIDHRIEVISISRDKYLFSKSLEAYYFAQDNPFVEPIIIHTNVENGQGIFSIENKSEFLIE